MQIVSFGQAEITDISKLVLAYVLGLPVGWYREREAHSVGLRTFPLVAAASCGYVLVAVPLGQIASHSGAGGRHRLHRGRGDYEGRWDGGQRARHGDRGQHLALRSGRRGGGAESIFYGDSFDAAQPVRAARAAASEAETG